ncbi:MAG: hypothetical protein KKA90_04555 [Nanoarchaeota archaeon]|nr:hypothetical protein [Nanoarchaeota archaeon]
MKYAIAALIAIMFVSSFLVGSLFSQVTIIKHSTGAASAAPVVMNPIFQNTEEHTTFVYLPAVSNDGSGILTSARITVEQGNGAVFADVDNVFTATETQNSFRVARDAAATWAGVDKETIDVSIVFNIQDAELVEGPSAGAAIAAGIAAAIIGGDIRSDIAMTGTINENGKIGPVGGILEKTKAAANEGIKQFLVPPGQGSLEQLKRHVTCSMQDSVTVCKVTYVIKEQTQLEDSGIDVITVSNLDEAMDYMLA